MASLNALLQLSNDCERAFDVIIFDWMSVYIQLKVFAWQTVLLLLLIHFFPTSWLSNERNRHLVLRGSSSNLL